MGGEGWNYTGKHKFGFIGEFPVSPTWVKGHSPFKKKWVAGSAEGVSRNTNIT